MIAAFGHRKKRLADHRGHAEARVQAHGLRAQCMSVEAQAGDATARLPARRGGSMSELSRDDVIKILGEKPGDAAIAEIIATGISEGELRKARDLVIEDRKAHHPGPALEPGHISTVVDILERLHHGGLLGEAGSSLE
jgi:hypothetical protein